MDGERLGLSLERIGSIPAEGERAVRFHDFFGPMAVFVGKAFAAGELVSKGKLQEMSFADCLKMQEDLYREISPEGYKNSICFNPSAAYQKYGETGRILTVIAAELLGLIPLLFEGRNQETSPLLELFLEAYGICRETEPEELQKALEELIFWYAFDYLDQTIPNRVKELYYPGGSFWEKALKSADTSRLNYLFSFGEYVSDTEIKTAEFLQTLPPETIKKMSSAFVEGFVRGFAAAGKDFKKKKYVTVRYQLGFERLLQQVVSDFEAIGLTPLFARMPYRLADKGGRAVGCWSGGVNKQFYYDHRFDHALFYEKSFLERKMQQLRIAYEENKEYLTLFAGPALIETFGEEAFIPENSPDTLSLSDKQKQLSTEYTNKGSLLLYEFIKMEETSFSIIAWPTADIASDREKYEGIFNDIITLNTLDSEEYQKIQQVLIDELDKAVSVEITGRGNNRTKLTVSLYPLRDPSRETKFENCVADVNIPVGEVFTTPVLEKTTGKLHVGKVYINETEFIDLEMDFQDGMVVSYRAANFPTEKENRQLVEEELLKNHKTLPMGEFAIGTNTLAYAIAKKHDIFRKLPILIAEKTGPHFAVGDTCYSREEDAMTYNPDKKAIIARDNAYSVKRKTDPGEAYFNCHTDITIPYDELGAITLILKDGSRKDIFREGRFLPEGTEALNAPLKGEV